MATRVKAGDVLSWERTFTVEDVRAFGRLSGDRDYIARVNQHGKGVLRASSDGIIR